MISAGTGTTWGKKVHRCKLISSEAFRDAATIVIILKTCSPRDQKSQHFLITKNTTVVKIKDSRLPVNNKLIKGEREELKNRRKLMNTGLDSYGKYICLLFQEYPRNKRTKVYLSGKNK